ncbi:Clp protease N-terminal domain-containing protein [Uliginosibacterium sp. H1]|uniref:Clp protease N-terminal domain-containing protein n=1 Tax=Uliginosibacterium sp. H1 TaxID=3114757 RepID=UPI002E18B977|nr:Clp protease N-terminal domain-containing protein [Uliginosibacterium sp. H1]
MLTLLRTWLQDTKFIAALCRAAETLARHEGIAAPGSEHFVLAALALPDGSAARAFDALGLDAKRFRAAIGAQFADALAGAGVSSASLTGQAPSLREADGLYNAAPSGQTLMQRVADNRHARQGRPLLAADVLLAVAAEEYSIAARALRHLQVTPEALIDAARAAMQERMATH